MTFCKYVLHLASIIVAFMYYQILQLEGITLDSILTGVVTLIIISFLYLITVDSIMESVEQWIDNMNISKEDDIH